MPPASRRHLRSVRSLWNGAIQQPSSSPIRIAFRSRRPRPPRRGQLVRFRLCSLPPDVKFPCLPFEASGKFTGGRASDARSVRKCRPYEASGGDSMN